jgi:Ca-activated chloride channel family protein
MYRVLICLLLLLSQDTLKVSVNLVSLGVRVTDSKGYTVTGLKAESFTVFDNGVPQKIEFFSDEQQPITMGILLDCSDSMRYNAKIDRAKEAAEALLRAARRGSEYFYITFDKYPKLAQDFTADPRRVNNAIQQTGLGGGTSLYDAVIQAVELTHHAQFPRQSLVIISDGADQHSEHTLNEVLRVVQESQVQIYTIGYFDKSEEEQFRKAQTVESTVTLINGKRIDNPHLVLERLARESGGEAFFPRSDAELTNAVSAITDDIENQYTVAFYPSSDVGDQYHQLRVAVSGGKYTVRARPGYGKTPVTAEDQRKEKASAYESRVELRNGRMFYHDDFQDVRSGWPNESSAKYSNDGFRLAGNGGLAINGPVFRDFRAGVSVSVTPPQTTGAGLVFRQTDDGYYAVAAFTGTALRTGSLAVFHVDANKSEELDNWPLIKKASPTVRVEVRCERTQCEIYQDGVSRGQIKNLSTTEGRIGLTLIGRGEAYFTDLVAEEIK